MKPNYVVADRTYRSFSLKHEPTGYSLEIKLELQGLDPSICKDPFEILFRVPYPAGNNTMLITGRDLSQYGRPVRRLKIKPSLQFVVVGAGMCEFIPSLVRRFSGRMKHKPIVIDPANYELMISMLKHARKYRLGERYDKKSENLIERCGIILDPKKVTLVNTTLGKALKDNPNLKGIADVVVDNCALEVYPLTEYSNGVTALFEEPKHVKNIEKKLLKPRGRFVRHKH